MSADSSASTLRSKTLDELQAFLSDLKRELLNLRFQKATGQLESSARIRNVRRSVARIKTIMTQKNKVKDNDQHS